MAVENMAQPERLILNNMALDRQREFAGIVRASGLDIKVRTGAEHGLTPAEWVEIVMTAHRWWQHAADFMSLLAGDARAALVGVAVAELLQGRKVETKEKNSGIDMLVEELSSVEGRIVLTVQTNSDQCVRLQLSNPSKEELANAMALVSLVAHRAVEGMETRQDTNDWHMAVDEGQVSMTTADEDSEGQRIKILLSQAE